MKKILNFTYLIRKKKNRIQYYYFYKDLWKNSELYLIRERETGFSFYYFYKDMCKKFRTLLSWSGRKETGFGFYHFYKDLWEKKNSDFTYLIQKKETGFSFYYFYKDLWKEFRALLTWSWRERPDSVFITFIMICEKIQNFAYLIWKKRNRIQFLSLL